MWKVDATVVVGVGKGEGLLLLLVVIVVVAGWNSGAWVLRGRLSLGLHPGSKGGDSEVVMIGRVTGGLIGGIGGLSFLSWSSVSCRGVILLLLNFCGSVIMGFLFLARSVAEN